MSTPEQDRLLAQIYDDLMDLDLPHPVEVAAERLASATGAEAVILFGSRARGDHDEGSDWDLCVILPDDVEPGRHTPVSLWPLVADLGIPIQVVPLRRSVFEAQRADVNSLSHDVAKDGVVLMRNPAGGLRRAVRVEDLTEDDLERIRAARVEPLQDDE